MKRINEIFYSLQGEGFYTGTPSVFVRFAGCNLKCSFCDTKHEAYTKYSDEDIVNEVCRYEASHVVLTGGEPSLQITAELVDKLHQVGKYVAIETNGTHEVPDNVDWVTFSPKTGATTPLKRIDELKVVYQEQDLSIFENIKCKHRFLQPCSNKNVEQTVAYILKHPSWRLSLQTHLLIGIQ